MKKHLKSLLVGINILLLPLFIVSYSSPEEAETSETTRAVEPLLGEISMFAGNFAPRGWAFCDGQLIPISQNPALFSILGTTYGGDGRTTFGLPDLRGRSPIQQLSTLPLVKLKGLILRHSRNDSQR